MAGILAVRKKSGENIEEVVSRQSVSNQGRAGNPGRQDEPRAARAGNTAFKVFPESRVMKHETRIKDFMAVLVAGGAKGPPSQKPPPGPLCLPTSHCLSALVCAARSGNRSGFVEDGRQIAGNVLTATGNDFKRCSRLPILD